MASPKPSRIAAALQYLQQMRDRAADFGGGVADTLADRARDVGGLAYEALTSDPNIGRMTTAEFADAAAARAPTPRLDAMGRGAVELGRAVLTQPVETGKAVVRGEIERARGAMESPRAMGQYAGEFVNPLRLAAALRRGPMLELDVYHGTPHRFEPTKENPLGELDASKIGTGEGAQAYGHGIYLAESPDVAKGYQVSLGYDPEKMRVGGKQINAVYSEIEKAASRLPPARAAAEFEKMELLEALMLNKRIDDVEKLAANLSPDAQKWFNTQVKPSFESYGSLYTLDLPDEMIDRMLDWDKPLSEQPETVRKALMANPKIAAEVQRLNEQRIALNKQSPERLTHPVIGKLANKEATPESLKGNAIYTLLAKGGNQVETSEYLRSLGIPGIKYLDAGSRGKDGTGTRNFVVFPGEEKKVKILRRE